MVTAAPERQVVVFELSDERFGIETHTVREIIRMPQVTHMLAAPEHVRGVINLRGNVIPVVNLRSRFSMPAAADTPHTRVLVVDLAGEEIGVVADAVTEVKRVPSEVIEPSLSFVIGAGSDYIEGVARLKSYLLILLDLERALLGQAIDVA
jgi:purine-binding chemotaxis protein CheW